MSNVMKFALIPEALTSKKVGILETLRGGEGDLGEPKYETK